MATIEAEHPPSFAEQKFERVEAIQEAVPQKKQGLHGFALIFACGAALFSDGYVNAISGPVGTILSIIYKDTNPAAFARFKQLFSSLAFAGTVLGMLVFGVLSDKIGRKFGMIFASLWLALFSVLSAGAYGAGGSLGGLYAALIAYRFLIGIAIGAEYPAGSVAASENTEGDGVNKKRQQMYFSLATNTMIDWGFVIAAFVPLVLVWICSVDHLRLVWRISLGLGAVPPLILLYFRTKMEESKHYQKSSISKYSQMPWGLILKRYWVRLLAICVAWWIYDWVTYPAGLYSDYIIRNVLPENASLQRNLGWGVVINLFYIPGTLLGALVNDRIGPKYTMIIGLLVQAVFGFALSGGYSNLKNHIAGFAILYGLFLSAGEFGPGNNLGLLASKAAGPTAVRGTFYGIAAAVGKIGAFVGTYVFDPISNSLSHNNPDADIYTTGPIGSGLALVSAAVVFLFIPNIGEDGMLKEDEEFKKYLAANGYDISQMGTLNANTSQDTLESHASSQGSPVKEVEQK
ncbi:glycerophosphoinositol permease [Tilletia horrida]|uniref:Glycerophosphoinositol permease n=1 Tax=Tilletia horrida TaxID=155126 RepID=A0AAN6GRV5_9BASI|nr:glycerophosphoinositol permease [Tilletia horrida]